MNPSIRDLMEADVFPPPVSVDLRVPVKQALLEMQRADAGLVLVYDGYDLVGLLTEHDVLRRVLREGGDPETSIVGEVMTIHPVVLDADRGLEEALALMRAHDLCHLPVMERGRVVAVLSIRHCARSVPPPPGAATV